MNTVPKHLYACYDSLAQFTLKIEIAPHDPSAYVEIKNRVNLMNPDPQSRELVFFDLGTFDDEKMECNLYKAPRRIGDLKKSFAKLDALSEKFKVEAQEGAQHA